MNVSSIGLTTVTPTTATPREAPAPQAQDNGGPRESAPVERNVLEAANLKGYGDFVDKRV